MRKLTIVFLALCIVLSVAPGAFAAEEVSDSALKAYGLLSALGIMDSNGVNAEDFLSYNARRDDLVYWAMRAVGWGDDSLEDKGYAVFNDVPAEDIKCRYINLAYYTNIVAGKSSFIFAPQDDLTGNEAVKVVVSLLGGVEMSAEFGGYPSGFWTTATKLGLKTNGIPGAGTMTNGDVAILLKNMLYATPAIYTGKNIVRDNQTVLEKYHNVKSTVGVISAAGGMRLILDERLDTDKNSLIINGIKMFSENPTEEYFGLYATVYYKEEDDENLFVYADISDNRITVVQSEDIISTKNTSITFNEKIVSFETSEKERTVTFSDNVDIVYNGRPCPTCTAQMLDIRNLSGEIILIGHRSSAEADVVIVNAVSNYVVASVDEAYKIVYSKLPGTKLDLSGLDDLEIYDVYGKETEFRNIFAGDVLSVLMSADGKSAKLITCSTRENRRVVEILDDNKVRLDNDKICIIDKTVRAKAENDLLMGRLLDISYDYRGRICDFVYSQYEDDIRYVYLTKMAAKKKVDIYEVQIKVYTLLGNFETYKVAEKLHLDGDYVTSKVFYDTLIKTDLAKDVDYVVPQMIKMSVNKDGEVNYIDTETMGPNEGEGNLHIVHRTGVTYILDIGALEGLNVFEKGYYLDIPKPVDDLPESAVLDVQDYEYTAYSSFASIGDVSGVFEVIDPDPAGWSSILVHRPKWYGSYESYGIASEESDSTTYGSMGMFDKAIRSIDENGEPVIKVNFYTTAGKLTTRILQEDRFLQKPMISGSATTSYKELHRGDIFGYDEKDGYLTWMGLRYNVERTDNGRFIRTADTRMSGHACGAAYGVSEKGMALLCDIQDGTLPDFDTPGVTVEDVFDMDKLYARVMSNNFDKAPVVVTYDKEKDKIIVGTIDDIVVCKDDNVCPSILVANLSICSISTVFAINNYK